MTEVFRVDGEGKNKTLIVNHRGEEVSFRHVSDGNKFGEGQEKLLEKKLIFPTTSEVVSLVYGALKSKNDIGYSQEAREVLDHFGRSIITFTGLRPTGTGIYVQDRPPVHVWKELWRKEDSNFVALTVDDGRTLKGKLRTGDSSVRFVSWDSELINKINSGRINAQYFLNNPLIRTILGDEESLEKFLLIYKEKGKGPFMFPHVHTPREVGAPFRRGSCCGDAKSSIEISETGVTHNFGRSHTYGIVPKEN